MLYVMCYMLYAIRYVLYVIWYAGIKTDLQLRVPFNVGLILLLACCRLYLRFLLCLRVTVIVLMQL